MELKQFKTKIYSKVPGRLNLVQDLYGKKRFTVMGNSWGWILGIWWMPFSAYSSVIYESDGSVTLQKRFGFRRHFDKNQYVVKITNNHNRIDNYGVGSLLSGSIKVPRGISCYYPVHALDYLANWSEIEILPDRIRYEPVYGFTPVAGLVTGAIDSEDLKGDRGRVIEANLIYKKRSKLELEKLEKLRMKMRAEDTEYFKEFDVRTIWNQDKWQVLPEHLEEPKDEPEELEDDIQRQLEEDGGDYGRDR
jgi:hypothetical protein